jgi:hypothetical protein
MLLSEKGCVYEVGVEGDVAQCIEGAMREGFTERQQENWLRHVAQLTKHVVFAFDETTESYLGRDLTMAANYLIDFSQG